MLAVHSDTNVFPNSLKFDPERFVQEGKSEKYPKNIKTKFYPFGAGSVRGCIGKNVTYMVVSATMIELFKELMYGTKEGWKMNKINAPVYIVVNVDLIVSLRE